MIERGRAVRERRETLGLSREALSDDTRIPVDHIAALEDGALASLPAGPYADAWLRALEVRLELPVGGPGGAMEPSPKDPSAGGVPLWAVRAVAGLAIGSLVAAVTWQFIDRAVESAPVEASVDDGLDQELMVRALENTRVRVVADGDLVREGVLAGGDEVEVRARERIELEVVSTGALRIYFNGEQIVPQGRQEEPRRLVFVDDGGRR